MIIAVDWGSSSFRAYRIENGSVVDSRSSPSGITAVHDGDFARVLQDHIGPWLPEARRVFLSGMITSRNGWVETPYAPTPAGLPDLARLAVQRRTDAGVPLVFLPGVSSAGALPDVMRGEETQMFGAVPDGGGLVVLPGTHSKWAHVEAGRITDFTTFMTGEVFALLRKDSLVSRLIPAQTRDDPDAFLRGVRCAADETLSGGSLRRLFSARSLVLFDRLDPAVVPDYLSGVLIGGEIVEAISRNKPQTVLLVGNQDLSRRYAAALDVFGVATTWRAGDVMVETALRLDQLMPT